MPIKIIDHKKIDMTNDEIALYESICRSYDDPPAVRGRDFFCDLFETDDNGIITFLKPPVRQTTMEVYIFIQNVCITQHLRKAHEMVATAVKESKAAIQKEMQIERERIDAALAKLNEKKE